MAILKRSAAIILMLLSLTTSGYAQQFEKQKAAFSKSYLSESKGDYKAAINTLREVYDLSSYEINLRLGWLTYKAGDFQESEGYYRKAVTIMPYGIEARFGLVMPLSSMGNWTQVIKVYEEILTIDPNNSVANYRYGLLLYNRGDYLKSEKLVTKTVNLYPFDYDSVVLLAWIKLKLNRMLEAKMLFQKVLLYNPTSASAIEGLSLIK